MGGIGFNMALFIAELAVKAPSFDTAKVGVLAASFVAAVVGVAILKSLPEWPRSDHLAPPADL